MTNAELTGKEQQALADAEAFAAEYLAPNVQQWEAEKAVPRALFEQAASAGLLGLVVPQDHGGRGISYSAMLLVLECFARVDMAAAFALTVHNNHARAIAASGSDTLIDTHLANMIAGGTIGAFLLTEPQGGSDATAITTTAAEDGDDLVINGEKAWITNTPHADLLNVYVQTVPGSKAAGIASVQVAADTPGVTRLPAYDMLGGYAIGAGGFEFRDVRVAKAQMLAPAGLGFKAAMAGIDIARASVTAMCAGMLRAGLDTAMPRLLTRKAFGGPLAEQQGLMWRMADVATDLEACRLMAFEAARQIDENGSAPLIASQAKKFATRAAFTGLHACMQVMGADGLRQEFPLARHLAAAKMAEYLDGTTEIQNLVIARSLKAHYAQSKV